MKKHKKRNLLVDNNLVWLVEDNLVALYIALHKYKDLNYKKKDIEKIIPHKCFSMRIGNFDTFITGKGLPAGGAAKLWEQLYNIFKDFDQQEFAELVNSILKVKSKLGYCYIAKLIQYIRNPV